MAGRIRVLRTAPSLAPLGGVLAGAVLGAAVFTPVVGAVLPPSPAFADTGPLTYNCPVPPSLNFPIDITVTGSIPSPIAAHQTFSVSNFEAQVTIPQSVAQALAGYGVTSMSGTTATTVNAVNATPSTISPAVAWGPISIPASPPPSGVSFDIPSSPTSVGPFTATNGEPGVTTGTFTSTVTTNTSTTSTTCTPPGATSLTIAADDTVTSTPSNPSTGTIADTAVVTGNSAGGTPGGTVSFYVCAPTSSPTPCTSLSTPLGGAISVSGAANDTADAASPTYTPVASNKWTCFGAYYSGDGTYPSSSDTSTDECVFVAPPATCQADKSCTTGNVSTSSGTVQATGTSSTQATVALTLSQASLDCGHGFNAVAQITTLKDSSFTSNAGLTVTNTLDGLHTTKGVKVCYQPVEPSPPAPKFLAKCKHPAVLPCLKSMSVKHGDVVVVFVVAPGDPRFHTGGPEPLVTKVSPASALPGAQVTITGANLSGAKVYFGQLVAKLVSGTATKLVVKVPAAQSGNASITILTPGWSLLVTKPFKVS